MSGDECSESDVVKYLIDNFDELSKVPNEKKGLDGIAAVKFLKAGTSLNINGKTVKLNLDIYQLPNGRLLADSKKKLGAGSNAEVKEWVDIQNGYAYAAKILKSTYEDTLRDIKDEFQAFHLYIESANQGKFKGHDFLISGGEGNRRVIMVQPKFDGVAGNLLGRKIDAQPQSILKLLQDDVVLFEKDVKKEKENLGDVLSKQEDSFVVIENKDGTEYDITERVVMDVGFAESGAEPKFLSPEQSLEQAVKLYKENSKRFEYEAAAGKLMFSGGMVTEAELSKDFKVFDNNKITTEIATLMNGFVTRNDLMQRIKEKEDYSLESTEEVASGITDKILPKLESKLNNMDNFNTRLNKLLKIYENMCRAVQLANDLGIILTDIKLENFIVAPDDTVSLIDFGGHLRLENGAMSIAKDELVCRGTLGYTTPTNLQIQQDKHVFYETSVRAKKIKVLLGIVNERNNDGNNIQLPEQYRESLVDAKYLEKLDNTAATPPFVYSRKTDAFALGCCGESLIRQLIPGVSSFIGHDDNGLPIKFNIESGMPNLQKINDFLDIVIALRNPALERSNAAEAADKVSAFRAKIADASDDPETIPDGAVLKAPQEKSGKRVSFYDLQDKPEMFTKNLLQIIEELKKICESSIGVKSIVVSKLNQEKIASLNPGSGPADVSIYNKFLEITKKLLNPDVNSTYVASQAAEDFEKLEQRIEALQAVKQQLNHPQSTHSHNIIGKVASVVQPYLPVGATIKAATAMTRQSPGWDNIIQTLAVDLDPTKHKLEVKADKSVVIKSKKNKKSVGSLSLSEGNVHGTTSDAEAFEQMLKAYIASHKPGEKVQITIVGLADDPRQAIKFLDIAQKLSVVAEFDPSTGEAVDRYKEDSEPSKREKP